MRTCKSCRNRSESWLTIRRPETLGAVKLYDVIKRMEAADGTKPKTLTGKQQQSITNVVDQLTFEIGWPHREEAILIQLKGAVVAGKDFLSQPFIIGRMLTSFIEPCRKCKKGDGQFQSCRATTIARGGSYYLICLRVRW